MNSVLGAIPGYTYGEEEITASPLSLEDLARLTASVGFSAEDERQLRLAGAVLETQAHEIVQHWRGVIVASNPNLSRHSRTPDGKALPDYTAKSNLRFEQWILDTCYRPYDQDWLNYQEEIALRHTSIKKKSHRRRRLDCVCAAERHSGIHRYHERDDQALFGSRWRDARRGRRNASCLV